MKKILPIIFMFLILLTTLSLVSCASNSEKKIAKIVDRDNIVLVEPVKSRVITEFETEIGRPISTDNIWYLEVFDCGEMSGIIIVVEFGKEQDAIDVYNTMETKLYRDDKAYRFGNVYILCASYDENNITYSQTVDEIKKIYNK